MLKIFPKLMLLFSIIPYISSCAVTSSYYDMTQAQHEYNECLNMINKDKDNCNYQKYNYKFKAEKYVTDTDEAFIWEFLGLETEEEKIIEQFR